MSAGVPKKVPTYIHMGKNIKSPTVHAAPRRRKAYIQWGAAWFPKGIVTRLLSLPQCHAAFGTIPSTLAWVDQSPLSQHVSWQPSSGYTLHDCYRLPRDPGYSRVQTATVLYAKTLHYSGNALKAATIACTFKLRQLWIHPSHWTRFPRRSRDQRVTITSHPRLITRSKMCRISNTFKMYCISTEVMTPFTLFFKRDINFYTLGHEAFIFTKLLPESFLKKYKHFSATQDIPRSF